MSTPAADALRETLPGQKASTPLTLGAFARLFDATLAPLFARSTTRIDELEARIAALEQRRDSGGNV